MVDLTLDLEPLYLVRYIWPGCPVCQEPAGDTVLNREIQQGVQ